MKALLVLICVLLAISNYSLMQDRHALAQENETLDSLVHVQQKTGNTLLSSLSSCRDTLDTMTENNQLRVLKIAQVLATPPVQARKKSHQRTRRRRKKPFKPFYILDDSAESQIA